jgi:hypothetical protein
MSAAHRCCAWTPERQTHTRTSGRFANLKNFLLLLRCFFISRIEHPISIFPMPACIPPPAFPLRTHALDFAHIRTARSHAARSSSRFARPIPSVTLFHSLGRQPNESWRYTEMMRATAWLPPCCFVSPPSPFPAPPYQGKSANS